MEQRTVIQHMIPEALAAAAAKKPVEVQLAWYVEDYKVLGITNTTILKPGEWISVAVADQIDDTPGWTTKYADNEVIQTLFGLGAGMLTNGMKIGL